MNEVSMKTMVVCNDDRALVSELKRVYGSIQYDGDEFVFLDFPFTCDDTRDYRPDQYTDAILIGDEIYNGMVQQYHVTLTYDGHVREIFSLGVDDMGRPDAVTVE